MDATEERPTLWTGHASAEEKRQQAIKKIKPLLDDLERRFITDAWCAVDFDLFVQEREKVIYALIYEPEQFRATLEKVRLRLMYGPPFKSDNVADWLR